ncbi:hypothetical protein QYF36_000430 [Acer negundo]|nr:hypothetical protein QYF36_000430 [Acer negundo]
MRECSSMSCLANDIHIWEPTLGKDLSSVFTRELSTSSAPQMWRRKISQGEGLVSYGGKKRATLETYAEVLKDCVSGKIDGEDISFNSHLIKRDLISVNAKNQLKEIENLAEKCCQVQISNKKGNCIVEDENLAFKSTYLTLRKDKVSRKGKVNRVVMEKGAEVRGDSSFSFDTDLGS